MLRRSLQANSKSFGACEDLILIRCKLDFLTFDVSQDRSPDRSGFGIDIARAGRMTRDEAECDNQSDHADLPDEFAGR